MNITGAEQWVGASVLTIIAFLFGNSGILKRWQEYFFKRQDITTAEIESEIAQKQQKIDAQEERILQMAAAIDTLKDQIAELDKDLLRAMTYARTLLAYLETLMPEGSNPFVDQIATEIKSTKRRSKSS